MSASLRIDPNWPLVLLPGTLCDARVFEPWFNAMSGQSAMRGRDVIHADISDCGSVPQAAQKVLELVAGCFIPVGFSLGAIVALELAVMMPDRVGAMVLVAVNARDVPATDHAERRAAAETNPITLVHDTLWPRSVAPARQRDNGLRELIADMARVAQPGTLALQTEMAITRSDKRTELAAMAMPALVLSGALDMIAPQPLQQELAARLPHATLHIAPDAGHFLPLERPDFCAKALAEWLASAPSLP